MKFSAYFVPFFKKNSRPSIQVLLDKLDDKCNTNKKDIK